MGMMRPDWSSTLRRAARNPARSTAEGVYNVESRTGGDTDTAHTETLLAPAVGQSVQLSPPSRIAEGSVAVEGYTADVDFKESVEDPPHILNLAIPSGEDIEVSYFLEDEEARAAGIRLKVSGDVREEIRYLDFDPQAVEETSQDTLRFKGSAEKPGARIYLVLEEAFAVNVVPYFYAKGERVYLHGSLDEVVADGDLIATLPEGMKPLHEIRFPTLTISAAGEIEGRGSVPEFDGLSFTTLPVAPDHLYPGESQYPYKDLYPY